MIPKFMRKSTTMVLFFLGRLNMNQGMDEPGTRFLNTWPRWLRQRRLAKKDPRPGFPRFSPSIEWLYEVSWCFFWHISSQPLKPVSISGQGSKVISRTAFHHGFSNHHSTHCRLEQLLGTIRFRWRVGWFTVFRPLRTSVNSRCKVMGWCPGQSELDINPYQSWKVDTMTQLLNYTDTRKIEMLFQGGMDSMDDDFPRNYRCR